MNRPKKAARHSGRRENKKRKREKPMNENKNSNEQTTNIPSGLTDGQKEKAKDSKDVNEPAESSGKTGVSLSDSQLEAVAGGVVIPPPKVEDDAYMEWMFEKSR